MSNARSPREVCSTTIGISGLMVLALFRLPGLIPPGKCKAAPPPRRVYQPARRAPEGRSLTSTGRPELLARGRTLGRDRDRGGDETVDRRLGGDILAQLLEAARLAQLREQLGRVGGAPALVRG